MVTMLVKQSSTENNRFDNSLPYFLKYHKNKKKKT